MNKKLLTILLSVLLPAFLVSAVVYATTSVGDAVSVGTTLTVAGASTLTGALTVNNNVTATGTLAVTGATTLNGNVTLGNAVSDTLTVWAPLVWAATTTTYGIDLNAATLSTADIRLQYGETIDNATDGTINATGKLLVTGVRVSNASDASDLNEHFLEVSGDITGIGGTGHSAKTFLLKVDGTRQAGADTVYADFDDAGIKVSVTNKATGNATGYKLRGMDVNAKSRDGGVATEVYGAYITGESRSGTTITNLIGVQANVKNGANASGNIIGLYVQDQSASQTGTTYGLLIEGKADAGETPGIREYGISLQSTNGSWGYGLDMDSATISTADIRLSNGALIANGDTSTLTITEATTAIVGNATVTNTAVADNGHALTVTGTLTTGTASLNGICADFEASINGTTDGASSAVSSWINLGASSVIGADVRGSYVGIYAPSGANMAGGNLYGVSITFDVDETSGAAAGIYPIRFNTSTGGAKGTPDALFFAANDSAVAYTANVTHTAAATDKIGAIKVKSVGFGDGYIYIYSHAGQ